MKDNLPDALNNFIILNWPNNSFNQLIEKIV